MENTAQFQKLATQGAVSFIEGFLRVGRPYCPPMWGEDITEIGQKCFTLQEPYISRSREIQKIKCLETIAYCLLELIWTILPIKC